jgi:TIR domain
VKSVFFSYSHKDETLRDQLETHLAMLKRQGVISVWHDRRLIAGDHIDNGIAKELDAADIILLLVSPDFLASDYCYGEELARALERHAAGEARVIPVILRPCDWHVTPFGKLVAVPTDGRPITKWPDLDDAFLEVTKAIRAAAAVKGTPTIMPMAQQAAGSAGLSALGPRSSNLRVRKTFSDRDRDRFLNDALEFMARFFENSLNELEARNPGLEVAFGRIDANRFTASIYRAGENVARCKIWLGGIGTQGIAFSYNANPDDNSLNESMSVEVGEQALLLRPLGMQMRHVSEGGLGPEGASEYYWSLFIERLQR